MASKQPPKPEKGKNNETVADMRAAIEAFASERGYGVSGWKTEGKNVVVAFRLLEGDQ